MFCFSSFLPSFVIYFASKLDLVIHSPRKGLPNHGVISIRRQQQIYSITSETDQTEGTMKGSEFSSQANRVLGYAPQLLLLTFFALTTILLLPSTTNAQRKCGGEGQRPCKIWERIPSCNKGLREHFQLNMCVGERTQVDARTGKHIPRDTRKMTEVSFCNRSSRPMIYAALAEFIDDEYGWVSRGWFRIPSGKCVTEAIDLGYTGSIYVYGSSPDGTEWDGTDADFCIKTYDTFIIDNADRLECRSREYSIIKMTKLDVKPGKNKFTFGN